MRSYNISKDPVAADTGPQQEAANLDDNAKAGFRRLIAWSGDGVECVVYEASGPFHHSLEQVLLQHGLSAARETASPQ